MFYLVFFRVSVAYLVVKFYHSGHGDATEIFPINFGGAKITKRTHKLLGKVKTSKSGK